MKWQEMEEDVEPRGDDEVEEDVEPRGEDEVEEDVEQRGEEKALLRRSIWPPPHQIVDSFMQCMV